MTTLASPENKTKIGGNYTATENEDGTFNVLDVPIFAFLPSGARRNEKDIDHTWMNFAVAKSRVRKDSGYLPPLHIRHHGMGDKTEHAGKFELVDVKTISYEGRRVPAIFANFLSVPANVFSEIEAGRLPYLSVEIHDWNTPEIDSLALLPDEVPFFRLPMLTIGKKVPKDAQLFEAGCKPAKYYKMAGESMAILFNFGGEKMSEDTAKLQDEEKDKKKDEEKMQDAPEEKKEEKPAEKLQDNGAMQEVLMILKAMAAKLGIPVGGAPSEEEKPDLAPVAEMRATDKESVKAFAALEAKVSALQARLAKRENEDKILDAVTSAKKSLAGYFIDESTEKSIHKFASLGKEALDEFVETFKRNVQKDPPSDNEDIESILTSDAQGEVSKFAEKGPKALEWAKDQARLHAEYVKATRSDMPLSDWLKVNDPSEFTK